MTWLRVFFHRLAGVFRKSRRDREIAEELDSHLQLHIDENLLAGMSPEAARRDALIKLGGVEQVKEAYRDRRGLPWVETIAQDLRYGWRTLSKSRVFTAVAVLSLGLGIGANTAIFSLIDAISLRMLPVRDPEQLVYLAPVRGHTNAKVRFSYAGFRALGAAATDVLSGTTAAATWSSGGAIRSISVGGIAAPHPAVRIVSENYFELLGVSAALGRVFTAQDVGRPVGVISYRYWKTRLGLDPTVLGRAISFGELSIEVIGVLPASFFGHEVGSAPEIWMPLSLQSRLPGMTRHWLTDPTRNWLEVIARLRPGIEMEAARARLGEHSRRVNQDTRVTDLWVEPAGKGLSYLRLGYERPLWILFGAVGLVLLIASVNVANLLLARAAVRRRELAIRVAVGASRWRIVRQILTEALMLAACGGALGWLLALLCGDALVVMLSLRPGALDLGPNLRVLGFTAAISLLTVLLFALLPAWRSSRTDVRDAFHQSVIKLLPRLSVGQALVALQVALSLVLLIGTGLLIQTIRNLKGPQLGYRIDNLYAARIQTRSGEPAPRLGDALTSGLRGLPWVESATLSQSGLYSGSTNTIATIGSAKRPVQLDMVAPGYFETIGLPMLAGRGFADREASGTSKVALVNEALARKFFEGESPIGRTITFSGPENPTYQIVGVTGQIKYFYAREDAPPIVYLPFTQVTARRASEMPMSLNLLLRARGNAKAVERDVAGALRSIDPKIEEVDVKPVSKRLDDMLTRELLVARLATVFSLLALALAGVGLYGVVSYSVARRTNEMGLRIALGATRGGIVRLVLRQTAWMVAAGIALGIPLSQAGSKTIDSLLFGVTSNDAVTMLASIVTLAVIALIGCYGPARRAARIEPLDALRHP